MSFKIIEPITITESILNSTTVTAEAYSAWDSSTTWTVGNYVIRDNTIFLCKVENTNKDPLEAANIYDGDADPVTGCWENKGATNPYRMFDGKSRAVSSEYESISFSVTPGEFFNAGAILNVAADSIALVVTDPTEGEVYRRNVSMLDNSEVSGWYSWLFSPIVKKTDFVFTDLPAYPSATVSVECYDEGQTVEIGEFVLGVIKQLGKTMWRYSVGSADYSKKEVADGVATLKEGIASDTGSFTIRVSKSKKKYVKNILRRNRAKGIVFIGHEDLEETISYAFLQDYDMSVENDVYAYCNIEIEELSA